MFPTEIQNLDLVIFNCHSQLINYSIKKQTFTSQSKFSYRIGYDECPLGKNRQTVYHKKIPRTKLFLLKIFILISNQNAVLYFQNKRFKIKLPHALCEKIFLVNKFFDINTLAYLYNTCIPLSFRQNRDYLRFSVKLLSPTKYVTLLR